MRSPTGLLQEYDSTPLPFCVCQMSELDQHMSIHERRQAMEQAILSGHGSPTTTSSPASRPSPAGSRGSGINSPSLQSPGGRGSSSSRVSQSPVGGRGGAAEEEPADLSDKELAALLTEYGAGKASTRQWGKKMFEEETGAIPRLLRRLDERKGAEARMARGDWLKNLGTAYANSTCTKDFRIWDNRHRAPALFKQVMDGTITNNDARDGFISFTAGVHEKIEEKMTAWLEEKGFDDKDKKKKDRKKVTDADITAALAAARRAGASAEGADKRGGFQLLDKEMDMVKVRCGGWENVVDIA